MPLRAGIPLNSEMEQLEQDELYRRHWSFNQAFLERHGAALKRYGRQWGTDPLRLWSRRWEYPFAAERVFRFSAESAAPLRILDAGSGVTYFPYFLCHHADAAQVTCCDSEPSYARIFAEINRRQDQARVDFVGASLQHLPLRDGHIDAVCCISVLEHTDAHAKVLSELARVLRPGGLLVLSFDLSLDGRFPLRRDDAAGLLERLGEWFLPAETIDYKKELNRLEAPDMLLSTDHVQRTAPELLPWRYPMLKALHDLFSGHGWTGGFRSKTVFCLDVRKK